MKKAAPKKEATEKKAEKKTAEKKTEKKAEKADKPEKVEKADKAEPKAEKADKVSNSISLRAHSLSTTRHFGAYQQLRSLLPSPPTAPHHVTLTNPTQETKPKTTTKKKEAAPAAK